MATAPQANRNDDSDRKARSYSHLSSALAVVLAIGGLAWASWTIHEYSSPPVRPAAASDVRLDHSAARPGTSPIPTDDGGSTFEKIAGSESAAKAVAAIGKSAGDQAARLDGLTTTPLQTSDQVAEAFQRFLTPLIAGTLKGPDFFASNGAKMPDRGVPGGLAKLADLLKFCDLDVAHASTHPAPKMQGPGPQAMPKLPPGGVAMMMTRNQTGDGKDSSSLAMPLGGLLPGADDGVDEDAPKIEVTVPARLKEAQFAGKKFVLGVILARSQRAQRWVPVMLKLESSDTETIKAFSKYLVPRAPERGLGAPPPPVPSDSVAGSGGGG